MIVYKLTFANGKSYIGQTVRPLAARMAEHRKSSNRLPVARAWARYGEPVSEIIATCSSIEQLNLVEIAAISEHGTIRPNGYNLCAGGQNSPTLNPEVAKLVGEKLKGRIFSPEARARMSEAAKARTRQPWSAETRAKMSKSAKDYWANASDSAVAQRAVAIRSSLQNRFASMSPDDRIAFSETRKRAWETRRSRASQGAE